MTALLDSQACVITAGGLQLRCFGRLRGAHRRTLRNTIEPGGEFRGDAAPSVGLVSPIVVAAGDGHRYLGQIEVGAEIRHLLLQGAEAPELAVAHLADEIVRPLAFGTEQLCPPRYLGFDGARREGDCPQPPASGRTRRARAGDSRRARRSGSRISKTNPS